jgi:hypothetical protein
LRVSLIQNGGWNPRPDRKGQLEYPETPEDLFSVAHYIKNIGVGLDGPLYP